MKHRSRKSGNDISTSSPSRPRPNPTPQCNVNFSTYRSHYMITVNDSSPNPVAARSKPWVCGLSLAGIVGSNPVRGMEDCPL
jgi:hypothetical protein